MNRRRVLVAPLDWGLGHATRCIPIVRQLRQSNCEVYLAGNGHSLNVIGEEFPGIRRFELSSYSPHYSRSDNQVWALMRQVARLRKTIKTEHRQLSKIINTEKIDLVISDNRFGCWSESVKCVFITHQINIMVPKSVRLIESAVRRWNYQYINKYSECWVPDWQGEENLSGILSHSIESKIPVRYIGPLSRMKAGSNRIDRRFDVLVILSGPEPQRSIFEKVVLDQLSSTSLKSCVVRGVPGDGTVNQKGNIQVIDFANADVLSNLIGQSGCIISRSGYSSIMDFSFTGGNVMFVPTPGQTEQEYLAEKFEKEGVAFFMTQSSFDLTTSLHRCHEYKGFQINPYNHELLNEVLTDTLATI